MPQTLVIGIGNDCRGDDAVGLAVADELAKRSHPDLAVIRHNGPVINAIDRFDSIADLIIVDAVHSHDDPGKVICLEVWEGQLNDLNFGVSSHGFSLAGVLELAKSLDRLPDHVTLFGIVGRCFDIGAPIGPAVHDAIPQVIESILRRAQSPVLERV